MPYPAPELISPQELDQVLKRLQHFLKHLPSQLPLPNSPTDSRYSLFLNFALDPNLLEKTGDEICTLGEQLEHVFGWQSQTTGDGILPIRSG